MKKSKLAFSVLCLFSFAWFAGCDKKVGKLPPVDPNKVNCDTVTYKRNIKPLVEASCAKSGCHDAATKAGQVEFTSYAKLKTQVDAGRIKARVIDGDPTYMPQDNGRLPEQQIRMIQCWLDKGAPEN
jgi:hypothetical protein